MSYLIARVYYQVKELTDKGLVEESEGARVIHCGKAFPLMAVKSDGG